MPEGDTIFRTARTLQRALAGGTVTKFETHLSQLAVVDRRAPIAGRLILDVSARGKHVLIELSGDLFLRSHLRMHGSWHLDRPGERWRAPRTDARIVVTTAEWIAIAFNVSDAEFLTRAELERHPRLWALGPDLLSPTFDAAEAARRIREAPARHIAEAILRQQSLAGLGNVFKSELLFLCKVHPFTPVAGVSDDALNCLIQRGRKLIALNVAEDAIAAGANVGRTTTGRLNPREQFYVYGRAGKPCFKCGTIIATASETGGRRTYWCPSCQSEVL
ncbi:MAG TPA: DNA-formamidopyrimidine glycosylase family protein [Vicinamibacterales bacterium]|nr:DNA-formamidopyrimidine glycosylase family protein [Vicinamibacterales bacterium]